MILLVTTVLMACVGVHSIERQLKQQNLLPDNGGDFFTDSHDSSFMDTKSADYFPHMSPGFFPSSFSSSNILADTKVQDVESEGNPEFQKRISRLVVDPHRKRWSEMFRMSPDAFRDLRNSGLRIRPFLRKDFMGGGFKMSYSPGKKRPYYYTEPEGSEFLGGPGK